MEWQARAAIKNATFSARYSVDKGAPDRLRAILRHIIDTHTASDEFSVEVRRQAVAMLQQAETEQHE